MKIKISYSLLLGAVISVVCCKKAKTEDKFVAPSVVSTDILADPETNNATITVTFSTAMDATSITPETFNIMLGATMVAGTLTYAGNTVTFTPESSLLSGTAKYTGKVTKDVKDVKGHPLAEDYVWDFTTTWSIITATAGINGTITPSEQVKVSMGFSKTFAIVPDSGYYIAELLVDGVQHAPPVPENFTFKNVTSDHEIHATFASHIYTISATTGPNGTITQSGTSDAAYGDSIVFALFPDPGYFVSNIVVDGTSVGDIAFPSSYTLHVRKDHTVEVSFMQEANKVVNMLETPFTMHASNTAGWWTPIVQYNNQTYMAFLDQNLSCILAVSKAGGTWDYVTIEEDIINDAGHTQQSIAIDGDGYIHIFYGMHSRGMKYKRSNIPGDITGGFTDRSAEFPAGAYTYPSLTTAPNGDIYLFIRNSQNHHAGEMFRWNNARDEWSKVADVAKQPGYTCYPDHIYASTDGNIHLIFEWRQGGAGGNRHLGSYARYNANNGQFYRADGTVYTALPITPGTGDVFQPFEGDEIWDSSAAGSPKYGMQSAKLSVNSQGNPVIAYAYSPTHLSNQYHYRFAIWDGTDWRRSTVYGTATDFVSTEKMWITSAGGVLRYYFSKPDKNVYLRVSDERGGMWSEEQKISGLNVPRIVGYTDAADGKDYLYMASPAAGAIYLGIVD